MLTMAARLIDEKLSAAYGVPIIYLNNLERATYANARQMLAILVKDALRPLLTELQQCIQRDLLMPMGGVHAKFKAVLDPEVLLRDEARVFNEIILARYDRRVITQAEAREALGYDPEAGPEEQLEVQPKPTNGEDPDAVPQDLRRPRRHRPRCAVIAALYVEKGGVYCGLPSDGALVIKPQMLGRTLAPIPSLRTHHAPGGAGIGVALHLRFLG